MEGDDRKVTNMKINGEGGKRDLVVTKTDEKGGVGEVVAEWRRVVP